MTQILINVVQLFQGTCLVIFVQRLAVSLRKLISLSKNVPAACTLFRVTDRCNIRPQMHIKFILKKKKLFFFDVLGINLKVILSLQNLKYSTGHGKVINILTCHYLHCREFYHSHAFFCDQEKAEKVRDLITYGISHLDFDM